jgi:glycosyltransferase involved in cell wall biosynthesis
MIKIVHLISELEIGGTEMMLYKTATRLDHKRFASSVVSVTSNGPLGDRLEQSGIRVMALGKRRGIPDPRALYKLYRILRRDKPALVQAHMYEANLYALVASRMAGLPVIWGIRCAEVDFGLYSAWSGLGFRLNRRFSRFADAIVVNSEAGRKYHAAQGFDTRNMVVIPNGFDLDSFQPNTENRRALRMDLGLPEDAFVVGRIARYDPLKDYGTLIRAASMVVKHCPNVYFLFVGAGVTKDNPELMHAVQTEGLTNRMLLLGQRNDVPSLMSCLDLAISSSISEGFPNVVGEAMASHVPCVVTDVGDSAYLVGETGRVVPPKDPAALAHAMEELVQMAPDDRANLGAAACRRIQDHFDIRRVAEQTEQLYMDVLTQKGSRSCAA